MNRYLFIFAVSVIAGVSILNIFPIYLLKLLVILLIISGIICLKRGVVFPLISAFGVIFGIIFLISFNNSYNNVYDSFKNKKHTGEVLVTREVKNEDSYHSFYGKIISIDGRKTNQNVYVQYYGNKNVELNNLVKFENGNILRHRKNMNPSTFNSDIYYKSENAPLKLTFDDMTVVGEGSNLIFKLASELNKIIKTRINQVFLNSDTSSFFEGLFLGDKTNITPYVKNTLSRMGISHVLAVSGMHVMILITLLGKFLGLFKVGRFIYIAVILPMLVLFCFMTGLEPSVIRASAMAILLLSVSPFKREYDSPTALSAAAIIIIIPNPYVVFNASFQLSFAAALSISVISPKIRGLFKFLPDFIADVLAVTISATFGTLPVIISTFGYLTPLSILGNLIIVPIVPILYVLGIISILTGFYPVIYITDGLFNIVMSYLNYFSRNSISVLYINVTAYLIFGVSVLAIFTLLYIMNSRKVQLKVFCAIICISCLICSFGYFNKDVKTPVVRFINSGQADCALLSYSGKNILIDTATENVCEHEVVPFLRRLGINKLDSVVLTHFHDDHAGGINYLAKTFPVDEIIIPATTDENDLKKEILSIENINIRTAQKGDLINFSGAELKVVSALNLRCDDNNGSLCLKLSYDDMSFLFMGDAETFAEAQIEDGKADILKVGHHGADSSSSFSFIEKVMPEKAIISVGENNSFGHPGITAISNLKSSGAKIHRTDLMGFCEIIKESY